MFLHRLSKVLHNILHWVHKVLHYVYTCLVKFDTIYSLAYTKPYTISVNI